MSWEAVEWANKQRLRLPQEQLILLLLANCADPDGTAFRWWKQREHWWTYLVEHSRQSRASVFRHLNALEEQGLAIRRIVVLADGTKRFEIDLQLGAFVNIDRDAAEADAAAPDEENQSHGETGDSQSHGETDPPAQSHGETESVSLVRLQEESPKESNTPPNPPPGGVQAKSDASREEKDEAVERVIDRLREVYPAPLAKIDFVRMLVAAMTVEQRELAVTAAAGYAAWLRSLAKPRPPMDAHRFLRDASTFPEYVKYAPKPPPPKTFVELASEEWRARAVLRAMRDRAMPACGIYEGREGAWFTGDALPPEALVLARYVDGVGAVDTSAWIIAEDRSQLAAWRERMKKWTGEELEAVKIMLDGYVTLHMPNGKPFEARRSTVGVRAPQRWPPTKADGHGEAPPVARVPGDLSDFEAGIGETAWSER